MEARLFGAMSLLFASWPLRILGAQLGILMIFVATTTDPAHRDAPPGTKTGASGITAVPLPDASFHAKPPSRKANWLERDRRLPFPPALGAAAVLLTGAAPDAGRRPEATGGRPGRSFFHAGVTVRAPPSLVQLA